jgi:hypothetical protein
MSNQHEPRALFVTQLEERVRSAFERRRLAAPAPGWLAQSRLRLALAAVALVLVSMAIGGGVVAAAYQAQRSDELRTLMERFVPRVDLARSRLALAKQQLAAEEQRMGNGTGDQVRAREARLRVAEAEAETAAVEKDLIEVRATSREPMTTVSAPLVLGADLVTDRWETERKFRAMAVEVAKQNAQSARTRFEIGVATNAEVATAQLQVTETLSAMQLLDQKIGFRQAFLKGEMSAAVAELRVLAAETELRRSALAQRVEVERRIVQDLRTRREIGTAGPIELAEAELRLQELQLAMTKADYDLALIRARLSK